MNTWLKRLGFLPLLLAAPLMGVDEPGDDVTDPVDDHDAWDHMMPGWDSHLLIDPVDHMVFQAPVVRCCPGAYIFAHMEDGTMAWEYPIGFPAKFVSWVIHNDNLFVLFVDCETYENVLVCLDKSGGTENWTSRMPLHITDPGDGTDP